MREIKKVDVYKRQYDKCPDCDSENIELVGVTEGSQDVTPLGLGRRRGSVGRGMGAGPPRTCLLYTSRCV